MTPGFNFKLENNINCLMDEEQFGCVFAPKFVIVVRNSHALRMVRM